MFQIRLTRAAVVLLVIACAAVPSQAPAAAPAAIVCGPLHITVSGQPPRQHVEFARGADMLATATFEPEGNIVGTQCRAGVAGPAPAVLVSNYTGGMHCCYTLSVYTTVPFRRVLAFDNNSVGWMLHPASGGAEALVLNDGHFDYYEDLGHLWAPSVIPLVACYRGGRFVDCTREFPDVIHACERQYADFGRGWQPVGPEDGDRPARGAALGLYLCQLIAGRSSVDAIESLMVRETGNAPLAQRVTVWLRSHSADARRWIKARGDQL